MVTNINTFDQAEMTIFDAIASLLEFTGIDMSVVGISIDLCVVDTNILINDLFHRTGTKQATAILAVAKLGIIRLVMSSMVRDEMQDKLLNPPKKIIKLASRKNVNLEAAFKLWQTEYLPYIRVIDPDSLSLTTKRLSALQARDHDDIDTAKLIELLQPSFAFSQDNDLGQFEVRKADWVNVAFAYQAIANGDLIRLGITFGGVVVYITGSEIVRMIANMLPTILTAIEFMAKKTPRWMVILAGCSIALIIAYPSSRAKCIQLLNRLKPHLGQMKESFGDLLTHILMLMGETLEKAQAAKKLIQQERRNSSDVQSDIGAVIGKLLRAHHALTAHEIADLMIAQGYQPRTDYPAVAIGKLMGRHPQIFTREKQRYWKLVAVPTNIPEGDVRRD